MISRQHLAQFVRANLTDDDILDLLNQGHIVAPGETPRREPAGRQARVARVKPAAAGPARVTTEARAEVLGLVQKAVADGATSLNDVTGRTGLSGPQAQRAMKQLREKGVIFQGGDRRFARYATTQEQADAASLAARGK